MGRRASREIAMKLLYQLDIQKCDREEQIEQCFIENNIDENDKVYINEVIDGVNVNILYLDKIIEKYSKGWKISRISKVDLAILRLSIYEVSFRTDIPVGVSINEAVELAKKFSGEESSAFVNGILGKISKVRILPTQEKKE